MGQAKAETRCISRLKAGLSLQLQALFLNWGSALGTEGLWSPAWLDLHFCTGHLLKQLGRVE